MNILRQIGNSIVRPGARELGTPTMALYEPNVATKKATFGMSWFWFPEAQFGAAKGVVRTRVGYAGGDKLNPTYYNLGNHTETVDIDFNPEETSFKDILDMFWKHHDPTVQHSPQYQSVIFYHDDEQKQLAEETMVDAQKQRSRKIVTKIVPFEKFYDAEDYHQKYLLQQHGWLLTALDISPGDELIQSHVAARVNGYIGGYGSISNFEKEYRKLGLNDKMGEYVKKQLIKPHRGSC